ADLDPNKGEASSTAAERLARMKPDQHQSVVARKLADDIRTAPVVHRTLLIRALGVWATTKEIPVLIQLLSDDDINTRNEVLQVIGKLRDERTVRPVIRCLLELPTQFHADQALKAMGPMAEKEVLALLDQPNKGGWGPAVGILKEIGTPQSIP